MESTGCRQLKKKSKNKKEIRFTSCSNMICFFKHTHTPVRNHPLSTLFSLDNRSFKKTSLQKGVERVTTVMWFLTMQITVKLRLKKKKLETWCNKRLRERNTKRKKAFRKKQEVYHAVEGNCECCLPPEETCGPRNQIPNTKEGCIQVKTQFLTRNVCILGAEEA